MNSKLRCPKCNINTGSISSIEVLNGTRYYWRCSKCKSYSKKVYATEDQVEINYLKDGVHNVQS